MKKAKTIGRSSDCDYIIYDPENRVSRRHAALWEEGGGYFIKDLGSKNGTFVNGQRVQGQHPLRVTPQCRITLASDYPLKIEDVFLREDPELTRVMNQRGEDATIVSSGNEIKFVDANKTVVFDSTKAALSDLIRHDKRPFAVIGRADSADIQIKNKSVSARHASIRMLNPYVFEIQDLGSTNGTFVDGTRIPQHVAEVYSTNATIRLGQSVPFDLEQHVQGVKRVKKEAPKPVAADAKAVPKPRVPSSTPTPQELESFHELELVWNEYHQRVHAVQSGAMKYQVVGSAAGVALSMAGLSGFGLAAGQMLGRYLSNRHTNKIKPDLSFENTFLVSYACPRCSESFQKKPWVTIRECGKCKVKYRS